jgi:hypothetical protein
MRLLRHAVVVLAFCGWFAGRVVAQEKFTTPLIPREVLFGNLGICSASVFLADRASARIELG